MFVLKHREIFIAKYPTVHPSYKPLDGWQSSSGRQAFFFFWYDYFFIYIIGENGSSSGPFDRPLRSWRMETDGVSSLPWTRQQRRDGRLLFKQQLQHRTERTVLEINWFLSHSLLWIKRLFKYRNNVSHYCGNIVNYSIKIKLTFWIILQFLK